MMIQTSRQQQTVFAAITGPRMGHRPQDYMVAFFPLVTIQEGFSYGRDLGYAYDYLDAPSIGIFVPSDASTCLTPGEVAAIAIPSSIVGLYLAGGLVGAVCLFVQKRRGT